MATSRFDDRDPNARPVILRDDDIRRFELLQLFPGITAPWLEELMGYTPRIINHPKGKTEVRYPYRERMLRLRKAGYAFVPKGSWKAANARYKPLSYALDRKGTQELQKRGKINQKRHLGPDFAHDFGSVIVPASFMLGTVRDPRFRFIESDEIINHESCPETTRKSDKPFSIPVETGVRFGKEFSITQHHDGPPWGVGYKLEDGRERKILCFLEFDRDTEPGRSTDENRSSAQRHVRHIVKLLDNDCGGYKQHFGTKFYVFIVTTNETRQKLFEALILEETKGKGSDRICLRTMPDYSLTDAFPAPNDHCLTRPWRRVGIDKYGNPILPLDIPELLGAQKEKAAA